MRFEIFFTTIDGQLVVRAGRVGRQFDGAVSRSLRMGNTTVGLTGRRAPVFVRLHHAEKIDATMRLIRDLVVAKQPLSDSLSDHVMVVATERANAALKAWKSQKKRKHVSASTARAEVLKAREVHWPAVAG